MKNIVILCVLVVMTVHKVSAQWPNHIDQSFSNIVIPDSAVEKVRRMAVKGNNTVITVTPEIVNLEYPDAPMLVNGVVYNSMRLSSDNPLLGSCGARLVKFADNSDSTFVLVGSAPAMFGHAAARVRVTSIANPDSTELAISFDKVLDPVGLITVKSIHLNDTVLYLLVDGLTTATTVEVVLNNGLPQPGTVLTNGGAAFLKIDRATGAILKQVYFNHNPNDGWLNCTHFNTNSLLREGNRFFFSSVSSRDENFILHVYDLNLNPIVDIPIVTPPYTYNPGSGIFEESYHHYDRVIGYGQYNGQEYLGLIPKYIPAVVNLTTLDVHYMDEGSVLNDWPGGEAVIFADSSFIILNNGWIKRIELNTMQPSIIRRDFVTNSPIYDGRGTSTAQRNARQGGVGVGYATLNNGQIEYYAGMMLSFASAPSGLYINGEQITAIPPAPGDVLIYKGSLDLAIGGPIGTQTEFFTTDSTGPVIRCGNKVIYQVDSADLENVHVVRTTGPANAAVIPGASDVLDFSGDTSVVVTSIDAVMPNDISTIWVYVESAVAVSADTSGISLEELTEEAFPLYPNPFRDYISIPEGYEHRNYDLVLYDVSGRIVFREHSIGNRVLVDHLVPGIYVARILEKSGKPVSTQKIVKQ